MQIELPDSSLGKIKKMMKILKTTNRSEIVRVAIDVAYMMLQEIEKGGNVILENKKGDQFVLTISCSRVSG